MRDLAKKAKADRQSKTDEMILMEIEKYRGLVLKLAWQYWKNLPVSVKVWVDPDDLIEEAYIYVISRADIMYDPVRAKKSTFLWTGVSNLLLNFALAHQTKKRFGWNVSLDDAQQLTKVDQGMKDMEAEAALHVVYKEASPELRTYIAVWFGENRPRVQWSLEARSAYKEFRGLAMKQALTKDDCQRLMRNGVWVND